ncbi:hypothetical protein BKM32_13510 [Mangrovimonas sp. DI 80]|nr:hypothetical protein BKM32_13510 [Mangrovimonas sp. DI 80]
MKTKYLYPKSSLQLQKFTIILLLVTFCLPLSLLSQSNRRMLNLTEFTVKMGHNSQFKEGVKMWKKCYNDNNGTFKWNMWQRFQGEGNVYVLTSTMNNWAELDKDDEDTASNNCRSKAMDFIWPHVDKVQYNLAESIPEISRPSPLEGTKVVWTYNVKISDYSAFKEVTKEISSTMRSSGGGIRGTWYNVVGGGPDVADFFIAIPFVNFAELDKDTDGVWEIYEKAHGKKKADELRAKFRSALISDWAYLYSYMEDLSSN